MKQTTLVILSFILIAGAFYFLRGESFRKMGEPSCLKVRAALDIGSGTTKMKVAEVNTCLQKIEDILFEEEVPVEFKEDIKNSDAFSKAIMDKGKKIIGELVDKARKQGASNISGVMTSAFRRASNGLDFANQLAKEYEIVLKVIDQNEEAKLGFYGAMAKAELSKEKVVVWDIGGGSMQIAAHDGENFDIYRGATASVSFKDLVIKEILGKDPGVTSTPNPLGKEEAQSAVMIASKVAGSEVSEKIKTKIGSGATLIGIGGVHYYSVRGQVKVEDDITPEHISRTLDERALLSDEGIGGDYASTDVTNLALVLGFMKGIGASSIRPLKVNLTDGILLNPKFW